MLKRKGFVIIACLLIAVLFVACGSADETNKEETRPESVKMTNDEKSESDTSAEKADEEQDTSSSKVLVVYFSRTGEQYNVGVIEKGNTAIVADMIIDVTGADSFEILPQEDHYPYTYKELTDVAKKEQNENARPAYAGEAPDLSQYDTIFIGAPVWWGDWPMICYTFFENNADALAGKTLIPFSTHEGSGLSGFDRKLASALPGSTVGDYLLMKVMFAFFDFGEARIRFLLDYASVMVLVASIGYYLQSVLLNKHKKGEEA